MDEDEMEFEEVTSKNVLPWRYAQSVLWQEGNKSGGNPGQEGRFTGNSR